MGIAFWIRRFVFVLAITFAIICSAQWLKGHTLEFSIKHAGSWALIATSIFIAGRYYDSSRGRHCALCNDTPASGDLP